MPVEKQLVYYVTEDGSCPFQEWLDSFRDIRVRARIEARLDRLQAGLSGDAKLLRGGDGVAELRLDFGPGYRVYFADYGLVVVILLCGGNKSTQRRDIAQAKRYWNDFKERNDDD